jgi:hypothetical protein
MSKDFLSFVDQPAKEKERRFFFGNIFKYLENDKAPISISIDPDWIFG